MDCKQDKYFEKNINSPWRLYKSTSVFWIITIFHTEDIMLPNEMPIFLLKIECVTGYTISVKSTSLFQNISTNCTYSFSWGTSLWGHYVCFWTSTKNVLYSTLRYSIIHCYAIAFVLSLKLYCLFNIKKIVQKFSHSFAGNDSCPLLRNRGEERVGSFSLKECISIFADVWLIICYIWYIAKTIKVTTHSLIITDINGRLIFDHGLLKKRNKNLEIILLCHIIIYIISI